MKIKLIVEGGKMQPGPAVSQQLGPAGVNLGKVISSVNDSTKGFSGMKVPVEIEVNKKTKEFTIVVFSPPVAELIKKEINAEQGSGKPNQIKIGNLSIESLIKIAKTKENDLLSNNLKSALKTVVGTCVSLGVLIDNKDAKEIEIDISEGKYDKEISSIKTEASDQKKSELASHFSIVKAKQDKDQKALEEAKAAAEAAEKATADANAKAAKETAAVPAPVVAKKK